MNGQISHKVTLQVGKGKAVEVWNVDITKKYLDDKVDKEFPQFQRSHVEFRCEGGKLISDTGYRSEFPQITGKVHNFVRHLAEELSKQPVKVLSKEVLA